MTAFILVCAVMTLAAVALLAWPFFRAPSTERRVAVSSIALVVPAAAIALYLNISNWDWQDRTAERKQAGDIEEMVRSLERKLEDNPKDPQGWLFLGRSYAALQRFPQAARAYQRAYDLTNGQSIEAMVGLGEALALTNEASITGRAGELFEAALSREPNHPKALWYGAVVAMQNDRLELARERLQRLLPQAPQELQPVLQRQIQDLEQQLASARSEGPAPVSDRSIKVSVRLAPELEQKVPSSLVLFVLARDPNGGPPLAVERHRSTDLPLMLELNEADAMVPTRTLAGSDRVQIIARLSRSGTPQAQSGDYFGQVDYDFKSGSGAVEIVIAQQVP